MPKEESQVEIIRVIRILARGRHAWVEAKTKDGKIIKIRKPIDQIPKELLK